MKKCFVGAVVTGTHRRAWDLGGGSRWGGTAVRWSNLQPYLSSDADRAEILSPWTVTVIYKGQHAVPNSGAPKDDESAVS